MTTTTHRTTTHLTLAEAAAAHGEVEGGADYFGRAEDVALGREAPEWAWPLAGAAAAYISAVGAGEICRQIGGVDASAWDEIADAWLAGFERGYRAAHALDAGD